MTDTATVSALDRLRAAGDGPQGISSRTAAHIIVREATIGFLNDA